MAYFNHAFRKTFLGGRESNGQPFAVEANTGMITDPAVSTTQLAAYNDNFVANPLGRYWGIFNANSYETIELPGIDFKPECCPIIIASQAVFTKDKIGPFHGGYRETNKSKAINAKYVSEVYRVDPCLPQNNVIHIGTTPFTIAEATPNCCKPFLCDETYYLRLDLKGSPALRFLTRNSYYTADYYTGCCADDTAPTAVDPTLVYIGWAKLYLTSPLIAPFILIEIFDTTGASIGSYDKASFDAAVSSGTLSWDAYTSPAGPYEDLCAGMTIIGAYVDTVFGNCTFYPTDFFQKEPIRILASEVDYTGDPCLFTGICVKEQCPAVQGNGFGDTVLKDLILSESYRQDYFATNMDLRIREVTQGYDISSAVNRGAFYTRFYILHNVPRFNNPTGVFDNDQYLLEIVVNDLGPYGANIAPGATLFEQFMNEWLKACNSNCKEVGYYGCTEPCILPFEGCIDCIAGQPTANSIEFYDCEGVLQIVPDINALPEGGFCYDAGRPHVNVEPYVGEPVVSCSCNPVEPPPALK